jgi:hypothetical protein
VARVEIYYPLRSVRWTWSNPSFLFKGKRTNQQAVYKNGQASPARAEEYKELKLTSVPEVAMTSSWKTKEYSSGFLSSKRQ